MTKTMKVDTLAKWDTEDGLLYHTTSDGERALVTSTPPFLVGDAVDEETGIYYTTVTFRTVDGETVFHTLDRCDLLSEDRIVGALAPLGANISSENARLVVRWITDVCNAGGDAPIALASTHLGWVAGAEGSFLPWGVDDVRIVVPDGMQRLARAFTPAGAVSSWAAVVGEYRRRSMPLRAMLAASAAAPIVRMLGIAPLVVYLWDENNSTMDAALRTAGSVWGDASSGAGYYQPLVPSLAEAVGTASFLRDVPYLQGNLIPYEDKDFECLHRATELALALTNGDARNSPAAVTLATGEVPLISDANWCALRTHVLELNGDPDVGIANAQLVDDLVRRQHGTAGQCIAHVLSEFGADAVCELWEAALERFGPLVHTEWDREAIVLVCLGDALLRRAALSQHNPPSWDVALDEAEGLCRWLRKSSVPFKEDLRELEVSSIARWVRKHWDEFPVGEDGGETVPGYFEDETRHTLVTAWFALQGAVGAYYETLDTLYHMGDRGMVAECPRPAFDRSPAPDPGNEWLRIDVDALLRETDGRL